MRDVVIAGGGITGLAAAYRLQRLAPHLDVVLMEASSHLGGKIGMERFDGFLLEWGPDCFLSRKPRGIGLCQELGLAGELVGRDPRYAQTFVLRHGRLHRLPEGLTGMIPTDLEVLTHNTLLSTAALAQLAQEPDIPPAPADSDESVAHFIVRRLGREVLENLVEPLMAGIYAGQADQLSLAATFPQLRQLELEHGSLLQGLMKQRPAANRTGYPPFVSFAGGMQTLVERLVEELNEVTICRETAVTNITKMVNGYQLSVEGKPGVETSVVIVTTPMYVSSALLRGIDRVLAATLAEIPYASTALVNLAFDEADVPELNGYGYVIPSVERREALACTWTSRKWQNRAPEGKVLLRVYIGRFGDDDVTAYEDGRLLAIAQDEIRDTLNITADPLFHRIIRFPGAMPQYNMGHLDRLALIEQRLAGHEGLFLAGAAFHGVGIPDCIASGEAAAARAAAYLKSGPL
jgi:oxygen-dependent protoporphyrinogen oxidase